MKYDFTKEDDWFRLIEFVFKANIVCICLVYPLWVPGMAGRPEMGNDLGDGVVRLILSSFISGIFLFGLTIVQLALKKFRHAAFDFMFVILAFLGGVLMVPPTVRALL
jgi:hypothetical protein